MCTPDLLFAHSFETQRNGLVFIYDMAGSNYTNFELDLSKKILNLLKVGITDALNVLTKQKLPNKANEINAAEKQCRIHGVWSTYLFTSLQD